MGYLTVSNVYRGQSTEHPGQNILIFPEEGNRGRSVREAIILQVLLYYCKMTRAETGANADTGKA